MKAFTETLRWPSVEEMVEAFRAAGESLESSSIAIL